MIAEWARARTIRVVALGHTQDDQAETVLMRLARGAGVDGLSAMAPRRLHDGITWIRPMLEVRRSVLQAFLRRRNVDWVEDPSNEDQKFERVRVRKALSQLAPIGIDVPQLSELATRMSSVRDALDWQAFLDARRIVRIKAGSVVLDWDDLRVLPEEISRRIVVQAIRWVSRSEYGPRHASLQNLITGLKMGKSATLEGCHAQKVGTSVWIFREYNAVRDAESAPSGIWDRRWRVIGPVDRDILHVRALGEAGIAQCPDWRSTGCPRGVLLGTPAIWSGETVVAAPAANKPGAWRAELVDGEDAFFAALLSH
jgi:tRNA(Ile)-lysidine synthase